MAWQENTKLMIVYGYPGSDWSHSRGGVCQPGLNCAGAIAPTLSGLLAEMAFRKCKGISKVIRLYFGDTFSGRLARCALVQVALRLHAMALLFDSGRAAAARAQPGWYSGNRSRPCHELHSIDGVFGRRRRRSSLMLIVSQASATAFVLVKPVVNSDKNSGKG
ncbi:hypothetical protein EVAR_36231_1 [Eumeta japonica]|uniref:Uncharacterized protein n=1 Tax=Eumeta variegata TaxID=151549 RepID=A0A4C1WVQ2_EUMVA|nr:hypothetical protein EVAR_36231_1 [Eumeta japonica]